MCYLDGCGSQSNLPPIQLDDNSRRQFLKGAIALPLATVLAYPELAKAASDRVAMQSLKLDDGTEVQAAVAAPASGTGPAVILIHEWWGLNDQIKSVAAEMANLGYLAIAVDLYGGKVASDAAGARELIGALNPQAAAETLGKWIEFGRAEGNGKVATMGWCFGGGWSLNASVKTPVDATVIYYGNVKVPAEELAALNGPVLGHFGTEDQNINQDMVAGFEAEMEKAGKTDHLTVHWYEANHAFANPTGSRYDAEDAALAWERTMAFLAPLKG
ncbi:MAG: dienelactone hydrolase family protein [Gammaproteobacteria bacterium]|nr:dienelactone hydrolase family protein [Gammaproteobacteria bacterium]